MICLQENLKNGLSAAERIIGKNLTLPILNNLLLKTEKGRLKISATNLEIGINYWVPGKIEKEGEITLPARTISGFVNNLPNKKIEIEAKDNSAVLKCENYKAKIKGQDAKDFPIIPKIQAQATIELDQEGLKKGLNQVVGMAAVSESRPEISGILMSFNKGSLKIVATDSFRLAEKIIFINNSYVGSIIIPQRTALEIIRVLSEKEEGKEGERPSLKIILGLNQILFDLGNVQLVSRLIDGQYPDYQQIIPKNFKTKTVLNNNQLLKTTKIASLFSSKINDVKFIFVPQKKIIEICAQNVDIGENRSQLEAEINGQATEVSFNWRYLLDGLNNIEAEGVFLGLNDESGPAILKPANDESYLYVVMPIKAT